MRLWSLHPKYLDSKGLGGVWREALLARAVLKGLTKRYKVHSQLVRFKNTPNPLASVNAFLNQIYQESVRRKFKYNRNKLELLGTEGILIPVTTGQVEYETFRLHGKLYERAPSKTKALFQGRIELNPIFYFVKGRIEKWEIL